jgi:hypothetical protein
MLRQVVFILSFFFTTAACGQQWFPLGTGLEHPFSQDTNVAVMFVDTVDNSLYVAGIFKSINGVPANNIARWDGQQWHALGNGIDTTVLSIRCITRFNGDIYVGGHFYSFSGQRYNHIARWDGQQWHNVGGGLMGLLLLC